MSVKQIPVPGTDLAPPVDALVTRIGERAHNLFISRQLQCAEAVMVALNQGLGGSLSESQAVALAAPFGEAMGNSGCMCGALSGAIMVSGLFLGGNQPYRHRYRLRSSARQLHAAFTAANGSACCRVLSRKVKADPSAHHRHCADLTARTAEMAARVILKERPELAAQADTSFLARRESLFGGFLVRLFRLFHIGNAV